MATSTVEKMLESLPVMVAGVYSNDNNVQLEAAAQLRTLLCLEIKLQPRIDVLIQSGVVPRLVEFLTREDFPKLQYEAAWALLNITTGTFENKKLVIDCGAVQFLVKLLASPSDDVRELAAGVLGNIAGGNSPVFRDFVLGHGALIPLLAQFNEHTKLSMLRNATFALSKFCQPPFPLEQTRMALPFLERLVHSSDRKVLKDACTALLHLCNGTNDQAEAVVVAGVCPRLVELLVHPLPFVASPALQTVGTIARHGCVLAQHIIELGALPRLLKVLLKYHEEGVKSEACWAISAITAQSIQHKQAVIEADLIRPLVFLLGNAKFDIKEGAAAAILNLTCGATDEQIKYLVNEGCIKPLCDLLLCNDPIVVCATLEGLGNILKVNVSWYPRLIEDANGLENINHLQKSHADVTVSDKARMILQSYWFARDYRP